MVWNGLEPYLFWGGLRPLIEGKAVSNEKKNLFTSLMHRSLPTLFPSRQTSKACPKASYVIPFRAQILIPRSLPTKPTIPDCSQVLKNWEDWGIALWFCVPEKVKQRKTSFCGCTTTIGEERFGLLSCLFSRYTSFVSAQICWVFNGFVVWSFSFCVYIPTNDVFFFFVCFVLLF